MPSIIIPAHNEQSVIRRTLTTLTSGLDLSDMEIVVVCNGCTDDTAAMARTVDGPIQVVETPVASKVEALNLGDSMVRTFPRVYLDADVDIAGESMSLVIRELEIPRALAAEPRPRIDTAGSGLLVRAYYSAALALQGQEPGDIGCGMYAMSRQGRGRFGVFPNIIADDAFARAHFRSDELVRVQRATSVVHAPTGIRSLVHIKTRSRLGTVEVRTKFPDMWSAKRSDSRSLLSKAKSVPVRVWPALPVYVVVQLIARRRARKLAANGDSSLWHRDESSRRRPA